MSGRLTAKVLGAAFRVRRALGPGLLESVDRVSLAHDLRLEGLAVEEERAVPVVYRGCRLDCACRVDLLVEGELLVELKAVRALERVHTAQVLTYMRLLEKPIGLLIHFNVPLLREGVRRLVGAPQRPAR